MEYLKVDHKDGVKLKRSQFEYQMAKDNLCTLLAQNTNNSAFLESDMYEKYSKNELDKYTTYMDERAKFINKYLKSLNKDLNKIYWNFWFEDDTLVYEIR